MYNVASSFPETSFILFVCSFCPFTLLSPCFLHSSLSVFSSALCSDLPIFPPPFALLSPCWLHSTLPSLPSLFSPLVAFTLLSLYFLHSLLFSPLVAFTLLSLRFRHPSLPLVTPWTVDNHCCGSWCAEGCAHVVWPDWKVSTPDAARNIQQGQSLFVSVCV